MIIYLRFYFLDARLHTLLISRIRIVDINNVHTFLISGHNDTMLISTIVITDQEIELLISIMPIVDIKLDIKNSNC